MAKFIRHDFGGILGALNKMIIAEVKAALELLPGKYIETTCKHRTPLCRIVVSDGGNYLPYDLEVRRVWIDNDGYLCFTEYEERYKSPCVWTEDDDMLDITDFAYLIDQIAERVEGDRTVNLSTKTVLTCDIAPEFELKTAIEKTI